MQANKRNTGAKKMLEQRKPTKKIKEPGSRGGVDFMDVAQGQGAG